MPKITIGNSCLTDLTDLEKGKMYLERYYTGPRNLFLVKESIEVSANLGYVHFPCSIRTLGDIKIGKGTTVSVMGDLVANGDIYSQEGLYCEGLIESMNGSVICDAELGDPFWGHANAIVAAKDITAKGGISVKKGIRAGNKIKAKTIDVDISRDSKNKNVKTIRANKIAGKIVHGLYARTYPSKRKTNAS